jgi:hypothetical protein
MALDALSNGEGVENVKEEWIVAAGKAFEDAIRRKLDEGKRTFRLRMSNIGKPSCQLQLEQAGTEQKRMPYNHVVRMLIGDAVEQVIELAVKVSGANITGGKNKVSLDVNGHAVLGEDDINIDDEVWDVKSSSPFLFTHKWEGGWESVYHTDTFGYVEQLFGYAKAQNKKIGGWIVVDKSSGEVKVVKASPTAEQLVHIEQKIKDTENRISNKLPFVKCFTEEDEYFRKKLTGNKVVPTVCTFCPFMHNCWPNAVLKPQAMSQAKEPKPVWYTQYDYKTNLKPSINDRYIPIDVNPDFGKPINSAEPPR